MFSVIFRCHLLNLRFRTIIKAIDYHHNSYFQGHQRAFANVYMKHYIANDEKMPITIALRSFCTEPLPTRKNVFGDLSNKKHMKVTMDEMEKAEEEFTENEGPGYWKNQKSPGTYANLIKTYLAQNDLEKASNILDLVKSNRQQPTVYMFTLLMHAYATNGDIKQCFKLFNRMKKMGLKPNDAIYTNLLTSVGHFAHNSDYAMEKLYELRKMFVEKNIVLNSIHYHAMMMAYGKHGRVKEAFQLADEMRDKKISMTTNTLNILLMSAIRQKEGGLKLALTLWHMMKQINVKGDIKSYNLLLRCMRDTDFGDLKVNDVLLKTEKEVTIKFVDGKRPNLLSSQPVVANVPMIPVPEKKSKAKRSNQPVKIVPNLETEMIKLNDVKIHNPHDSLNDIHKQNRLILFGGFEHILELMKNDGVEPDVKTLTYLMEMLPDSPLLENMIIKEALKRGIELDVAFFNILMKKRCYRHDYDSARNVLKEMEKFKLYPDVITWGTLAMTCDSPSEIKTFIETMESVGFAPDNIIIGILMIKTSRFKRPEKFKTLVDLIRYSKDNGIKPSRLTLEKLDTFIRIMKVYIKQKDLMTRSKRFQINFGKFLDEYQKWRAKEGPTKIVHTS